MSSPRPAAVDPLEPLVGKTLGGRYEIEALLGRGGMASVFRARDRKGQRAVAVKVLAAESAENPELVARFQREAATGKRIEHPNVASVFDDGTLDDGGRYFVMELLEGRSLDDALAQAPMPAARAVALIGQVLDGLSAAHRLGITHRDVKPDNLMLVGPAGRETVKIVDFGIAANDRAAYKLTTAGIAFGTPEYISPEMAMGLAVDPRADLYSVGVVLFQLVTGKLPFAPKDRKLLLAAHAHEAPPRPREVAPRARIAEPLEAVILRALAKLPEERFASAGEMKRALEACRPRAGGGRWALAVAVLALLAAAVAAYVWFAPAGRL